MKDQFDAGTHKTATPAQTQPGTISAGLVYYWFIEYEIPPLRAIYQAECDDCPEGEVRKIISEQSPPWKIRKLDRRINSVP